MNLMVKNARVITFGEDDRIFEGYIVVRKGKIEDLGEGAPPALEGFRIVDAGGRVLIPGFVNMHTHLYSSLARGMPHRETHSFYQILEKVWWKLDIALEEEDVYLSALVGIMDSVKRGVTTIFDHHSSPNFTRGSLDVIEGAMREIGIRGSLSYEVTDRNGKDKRDQGIEENVRFARKVREDPMIKSTFGLHASFTLSDETLIMSKEALGDLRIGFHIHLAEGPEDQKDSLKRFKKRVTERLHRLGMLGERTLTAHGVHLEEKEMDILKKTKTPLIHNPSSNMNNRVGWAQIPKMLKRGVNVGLGTDGFGQDLLLEMRNAFLMIRHSEKYPEEGIEALSLLKNNWRIAGLHFRRELGRIERGAPGDLVLFDYIPPTPLNPQTLFSHLLFGLSSSPPKMVIVDGEVIFEDGEFKRVDQDRILSETRERSKKLWERI